jgi:predicted lipoprotein with Yx(FWY)xxD motif
MASFKRLRAASRPSLILGPLGLSILVAACGSAVGSAGAYGNAPSTGAASAQLQVNEANSKLGSLLTDGQGRTLYLFENDTAGASTCSAACVAVWPAAATTGGAQAGPGVSTSMLSTIQRSDGSTQVTYNGHPLYRYVGDTKPSDTNGQGLNQFGAGWYVVSPNGSKIDNG